MRSAARIFALLSGSLLLSACSWFGGGDKKMSPLTEYTPTAKASIAWQKSVGKRSPIGFAPLIRDGVVYVLSGYGRINGQPGNLLLALSVDGK